MSLLLKIVAGIAAVLMVIVIAAVAALTIVDPNRYRGLVAEQVEQAIGREVSVNGDLSWGIGFPLAVTVEGFRIANAEWGSEPDMVTVGRAHAEIELLPLIRGEVQIAALELQNVNALLETASGGRNNWTFEQQSKQPDQQQPQQETGSGTIPSVREVGVRDVTITYHDQQSGESVTAVLDRLDVTSESFASPLQVALQASFNEAPIDIQGTVGSLEQLLGSGEPYPVSLAGTVFGTELDMSGEIAEPLQAKGLVLEVKAKAENLSEQTKSLGMQLPALPPITVSGRLTDIDNGYAIENLNADVGGSDLGGLLQLALGGERPKLTAKLTSQSLDLSDFIAAGADETGKSGPTKQEAAGAASGGVFPGDPLPFDALALIDADVDITIQRLAMAKGITADRVSLVANLSNGNLVLRPDIKGFAGGAVSGEVQAAENGSVAVDLTSKGVVTGDVLKALAVTEMLAGAPLDGRVDVKGKGKGVKEIMGGLSGNVRLVLGKGTLDNGALELTGGDALTQLIGVLNPFAERDRATTLTCGVLRTSISGGKAQFDNSIGAETEKMSVIGAGAVNLKTEELDIGFRTDAAEGLGLSVAEFAAQFVRIKGTLSNPSVGVDPAGSAGGAIKLGATVGTAVATGGISLIAPAIIAGAQGSGANDACQVALGNVTGGGSGSGGQGGDQGGGGQANGNQPQGQGSGGGGALGGAADAVKGLFGN